MNKNMIKKEKTIQNSIFAVSMIAAAVFLLWKCRYGFANMDESLYLAIPYRFYQGDSMFVHEWNLSSFSSFLLLPFIHIYMAIFKTTEGILLNFRYIFVAVQALVCVFLYIKLKRYNWLGAFAGALSFFMYAPFSIMALSYNSIGIQSVTIAAVLLLTNEKNAKLPYVAAGVCFAAAVLCCPYLVAVYALYSILVLINSVRKNCFTLDVLKKDCWFWITIGISALAGLFLVFSLAGVSVADIIVALKWMLNDPQHKSVAFSEVVKAYITGILNCSNISVYIFAAYAVLFAVLKITKGKVDKTVFFCVASLLCGLMMLPFVTTKLYINFTMFPVNILALFCIALTENETVKRIFKLMWIPAALYSFCIHMASNQGFNNISSVFTVSIAGSLIIVALTAKELAEKSKINIFRVVTVCAVSAVLLMQVMCVFYTRHQQVFWENGRYSQTELLAQGPEKGILASEHRSEPYEEYMQDSMHLWGETEPESVLYLSQDTWMYLASEYSRMATFSPWLPGADEEEMKNSMERLYEYFEINPDKMPQVVYALEKHHKFAEEFARKYGYTEALTPNGNYIYTR